MSLKRPLLNRIYYLFLFVCLGSAVNLCILWGLWFTGRVTLTGPLLFTLYFAAGILFFALRVHRPFRETEKILRLFTAGLTLDEIYKIDIPYSEGMQGMVYRINKLLDTRDFLQAGKRQEQFLALQNQINPHFLYNTLEGIRSEAMEAGLTSIAEMTEALSRFFRYTISNMDNLVSLENELDSVQTYFLIQQYRFGKRLQLRILRDVDITEELSRYKLPKLILQPIVENGIIHGLERKVGDGVLTVRIEKTERNLIITVSDDGIGMNNASLSKLHESLSERSLGNYEKESPGHTGIAILNVNNRIKLLFGEQYGVTITSTPNVGSDVEIFLPSLTEQSREEL